MSRGTDGNLLSICLQMLKGSPTPGRWSSLEKRSMHHWSPIANRNTPSSREGKRLQLPQTLLILLQCRKSKLNLIGALVFCSSVMISPLPWQVCEAPPATASTAIYRLEVFGASLLLQADW